MNAVVKASELEFNQDLPYYLYMDITQPFIRQDLTNERLGVLAYDIVLSGDDIEVVAERNEIDSAELRYLINNNTHMASTIAQLKQMVKMPDDDAGFGVRLRSHAEAALPEMNKLMSDDSVTPELKVGIFKAYLSFITNRDKIEVNANGGSAVQVNFVMSSNVRGMKEITAQD